MNLSLSFNFNSKITKMLSSCPIRAHFQKSESDSTQNSKVLSELASCDSMSLNSPNTGRDAPQLQWLYYFYVINSDYKFALTVFHRINYGYFMKEYIKIITINIVRISPLKIHRYISQDSRWIIKSILNIFRTQHGNLLSKFIEISH